MAAIAVSEDKGGTAQVIVRGIGMLECTNKRMTALAGHGYRAGIPAAPGGDGLLNLLVAAAMAGLAIGAMGRIDLAEGVARVGVAADRTIRCRT